MPQKRPDRTLGGNHDVFWEWCGKGELRIQRCANCGHQAWPARQACEVCRKTDFAWERLSGRGAVVSWTSFEREYYYGTLPLPYDTILVELEGGPLFLSNPQGFTWREMTPGMAVQVTFVDAEDSAGGFRLPVFARG